MKRIVIVVLAGVVVCCCAVSFADSNNKNGNDRRIVKRPVVLNQPKKGSAAEKMPDVNDRMALRQRLEETGRHPQARMQTAGRDVNDSARERRLSRFHERQGLRKRIEAQQGNPEAVLNQQQQQQVETIKEQMTKEEVKHRWRLARLERIRELAGSEGTAEMVTKVDGLLGKELMRYETRRIKFAGKLREIYMGKIKGNDNKDARRNQTKRK